MVGTIIPMVNGNNVYAKYRLPLIGHTLGALIGGSVTGVTLFVITFPLHEASAANIGRLSVAAVSVICALRAARIIRIDFPQPTWQVPNWWTARWSSFTTASLYGICLGSGVLTRINVCFYPMIVWSAFNGRLGESFLAMILFALFRTSPIWLVSSFCGSNFECSSDAVIELNRWHDVAQMANSVALAMFSGVAISFAAFA